MRSKSTRQQAARRARRTAGKVRAIEAQLYAMADDNPTGYNVGSATWQYFQDLQNLIHELDRFS